MWARARAWLCLLIFITLPLKWGTRMENWGYWDWIAYGGISIAALILAIETGLGQSSEVSKKLPRVLQNRRWGYIPLVMLILSFAIFLAKQNGIIENATPKISKECMTFWGPTLPFDHKNLMIKADGKCFSGKEKQYYLTGVAFHSFGVVDMNDEVFTVKGESHDIIDRDISIMLPLTEAFLNETRVGIGTNYGLFLVPKNVPVSQFSTLRQAKTLGAILVSDRQGPP